jgi:riboflavin biosynthesis pyrimidine reductase
VERESASGWWDTAVRCLLPPAGTADLGEDDLLEAYRVDPPGRGRVHVRVGFVASADGAAELDGHSEGLSGPADKRVFRLLRGLADVVLVGAGTARREDYGPVRLAAEVRDRRRSEGQAPLPPLAVVTARLELDLDGPVFTEAAARTVVVTTESADPGRRAAAARVADVVIAGDDRVSVEPALAALAQRGLGRVLCEGGPTLVGDLVAADRLDELCLTVAPLLAGGGPTGRVSAGAPSVPRGLRLAHVLEEGGNLFLRYARR